MSPSALNLYNKVVCIYYHYLADIKINDELTEHSDERTIGNAIHITLDMFTLQVSSIEIYKE